MPRDARIQSKSGMYHVMLRGINRQQIFENEQDYGYFLRVLKEVQLPVSAQKTQEWQMSGDEAHAEVVDRMIRSGEIVLPTLPAGTIGRYGNGERKVDDRPSCIIYAYCLMGNHVHLLIHEQSEPIAGIVKRIASSYVFYYNHVYQRVGHLFQERFHSEVVEDMNYFVTLLRYIHQNPVKAEMCERIEDYPWSSWREYVDYDCENTHMGGVKDFPHSRGICRVDIVLRRLGFELVDERVHEKCEDKCMDMPEGEIERNLSDYEIKNKILEYSCCETMAGFQRLERVKQKEVMDKLKEEGAKLRQLSRLSGISYTIVRKM